MEFLKINDQLIEYKLAYSKRARIISYTIKDGRVFVTLPPHLLERQAKDFILENGEEIVKKICKIRENDISPYQYQSGEKFFYRGRQYTLQIAEEDHPNNVLLQGGHLYVYIPPGLDENEKKLAVRSRIDTFFQDNAFKILDGLARYYSRLMEIPYKPIKIKNQRTRWGSCSNSGSINLNWRIIMAPNQVITYVVIHELTHLKYEDHSREFWALVAQHMPEYKKWKKWLADNSESLAM